MHRDSGGLVGGGARATSIRVLLGMLAALIASVTTVAAASAEAPTAVVFPGSPLTVAVGSQGQCESSYPSSGGNYFPGSLELGDCGFFLAFPKGGAEQPVALQGKTFGFIGFAGPGLADEYTPVSQSPVAGSGSEASPYTETTIFKVMDSEGKEDAIVTETTTYVNGAPQFTSTYDVKNVTGKKLYFRAIYAGDLYVNGNDFGTGVFLAGPPRFVGGQNTASGILGGFQEAPAPALPWSSFQEGCWNQTPESRCEGAAPTDQGIWNDVRSTDEAASAFNETIDAAAIDNAVGVEWDQLREAGLEAGGEQAFTIVNRTQAPSALQVSPAHQTLTQGQTETLTVTAVDTANQPYAGRTVRYTVAGANPQAGSVVLGAAGQAQISYVGQNAGVDTTQMFLDLGGSGVQTSSDPTATATATFVPAPPVPNSTYRVQSIKANPDGTITIVFVPTQAGTATLEVTVPTGTIARREAIAARRSKRCGRGMVRIKRRCRPKATVTGRTSATGTAGVALKLTVAPSGAVVRALRRGRNVKLTATLTYRSALGGQPTIETFHVTVKGRKKRRKH
jgi:hypothetical protein